MERRASPPVEATASCTLSISPIIPTAWTTRVGPDARVCPAEQRSACSRQHLIWHQRQNVTPDYFLSHKRKRNPLRRHLTNQESVSCRSTWSIIPACGTGCPFSPFC